MRQQQSQQTNHALLEQSPAFVLLLRWLARINQRYRATPKATDNAQVTSPISSGQSQPSRTSDP